MENGQAKTHVNGHSGPAKAAPAKPPPKSPPPNPFAFVDELPAKVRALVEGAATGAKKDTGDKRYLEGLRRGAYLVAIAMQNLDTETRQKVIEACAQLEEEVAVAEKALRDATK